MTRSRGPNGVFTREPQDGNGRGAYWRGYHAQRTGVRDDQCPYKHAYFRKWWLEGWDVAYEESLREPA